jgi:hypothetical protein
LADVAIMIGSAVIACDLWLRRRGRIHATSVEDQSQ